MPIIPSIAAMQAEMMEWRHDFHAHPELGFEETRTADLVASRLAAWGLEVHRGLARTGVVGVLKGREPIPRTLGLRADMDALAMTEANDLPYRSQHPGRFHGCGHDGHTTMLLGAARYLAATRQFAGTVHFIFQPAEEGRGGAETMVAEGLFARFPCDEIYALHNSPRQPMGEITVLTGPVGAAVGEFDVTIQAKGGHAALPHLCTDPVVIAAQLVTALQTLVSRQTDPLDSAVLSVTRVEAGSTYNVIPETARLCGTVRTLRAETEARVKEGMARLIEGIGQAFGADLAFAYRHRCPVLVNPVAQSEVAAEAAARVVGRDHVHRELPPIMGAEDFAFLLNVRPGAYLWVGQAGGPSAWYVHHPRYDFNDAILPIGASVFATLVEMRLGGR